MIFMLNIPILLLAINIIASSSVYEHSIKYAYSKILRSPVKYTSQANDFNISADQINFHSPQCDQMEQTSNKIAFKDCTVFSVFNLTVTVLPNYTFYLQDFFIEYHYPEITYQLNQKVIEPSISNDISSSMSKGYSFNLFRAPLASTYFQNLTTLMHNASIDLWKLYRQILINSFITEKTDNQLESDLSSAFILLYKNSIVVETKDPKVTYYSFLLPQATNVVNLNETTIIGNMIVQFEYSLNYNLTYNEGNFTLLNFAFETNLMIREDPFKECKMDNFHPANEEEYVQQFIFEKFKKHLIDSINKYLSLKALNNNVDWPKKAQTN